MKKFFFVLALFLTIFCSCQNKDANTIANKLHDAQTLHIVGVGEINTISAEDNDLIFSTDASARHLNYDIINKEDSKYMIGDNAITTLFKLGIADEVIGSDINLVFRFQWNDGKKIDVRFSPSEIQSRAKSISQRFNGNSF